MTERQTLNLLKHAELKSLCKEEGLAASGRKSELIERLIERRQQELESGGPDGTGGDSAAGKAGVLAGLERSAAAAAAPRASAAPAGVPAQASPLRQRPPPAAVELLDSPSLAHSPGPQTLAYQKQGRGRGAGPGRGRGRPPGRGRGRPPGSSTHSCCCANCSATWSWGRAPLVVSSGADFCCPKCRFEAMDPFNPMVAMRTPTFVPSSERLNFTVELPALEKLRQDGLGLEVRMVRLSCGKVAQAWPQQLEFFANGVRTFSVAQRTDGHKRRDVPQSLSDEGQGLGLRPGKNELTVNWLDANLGDFAMAVVQTRPRSIEDLCREVPPSGPHEVSCANVRRLVAARKAEGGDGGEVMCLSSDTMRLRCPITMERMHDPVRGAACQHLQCFGLQAYLLSNRQMRAFNQRWVCPVCSLVLRPADLRRDAYAERVLAETPADVDEVVVAARTARGRSLRARSASSLTRQRI